MGSTWPPELEVTAVDEIAHAIRNSRFRFSTETRLCDGLEILLRSLDVGVIREHRLDGESRLDFWVPSLGLCIEVKTKRSEALLLRQLEKYALHPSVRCILVVTSRMQLAALPLELNGKPLRVQPLVASLL